MEEHECIIGMWLDCEDNQLLTFKELKDRVEEQYKTYEYAKNSFCYEFVEKLIPKLKLNDYFDRRKNTNLIHFDYCPYCGNKIDWKKMKKEYENEIYS